MKEAVTAELLQHAADKLPYAALVTTRMVQLSNNTISPLNLFEKC